MTASTVTPSPPAFDDDAFPVSQAIAQIGRLVHPIQDDVTVPLAKALGRILSNDVISALDVPASDNAAMDGYSLSSADLALAETGGLEVVGEAFAGRAFEGSTPSRCAIRIMTGAVMPTGHDTVVPQELTQRVANRIVVPPGQLAGQNRRLLGEDLQRGQPALRSGQKLGAAELGLLASLGINEVTVRRRIRVAILSTGDELQAPGTELLHGKVFDSNRFTLMAMLERLNAEVIDLGIVEDDPQALEAVLRRASKEADAIISSAGVSVGEADFTREVMAQLGQVEFHKIAMRPGRPLAFGRLGSALYFGLPGNPVAVMMTFIFLVRGALQQLAGGHPLAIPSIKARAAGPIRKRAGRTEYQRAYLRTGGDGMPQVELMPNQGSAVLSTMARADCIVVLEHERKSVAVGEWVDCIPMGLLA